MIILDDDVRQILLMSVLGLLGGAVRVCNSDKITGFRMITSSLLTSMFAAGVTGALLHEYITDPVYLGGICGMGGYLGQITLIIITKFIAKKTGLKFAGGFDGKDS